MDCQIIHQVRTTRALCFGAKDHIVMRAQSRNLWIAKSTTRDFATLQLKLLMHRIVYAGTDA
jgi:hypothetical protein